MFQSKNQLISSRFSYLYNSAASLKNDLETRILSAFPSFSFRKLPTSEIMDLADSWVQDIPNSILSFDDIIPEYLMNSSITGLDNFFPAASFNYSSNLLDKSTSNHHIFRSSTYTSNNIQHLINNITEIINSRITTIWREGVIALCNNLNNKYSGTERTHAEIRDKIFELKKERPGDQIFVILDCDISDFHEEVVDIKDINFWNGAYIISNPLSYTLNRTRHQSIIFTKSDIDTDYYISAYLIDKERGNRAWNWRLEIRHMTELKINESKKQVDPENLTLF